MESGKKTKNHGKQKHPLDDMKNDDEVTENVKKEICSLQDLEYGEKIENLGK